MEDADAASLLVVYRSAGQLTGDTCWCSRRWCANRQKRRIAAPWRYNTRQLRPRSRFFRELTICRSTITNEKATLCAITSINGACTASHGGQEDTGYMPSRRSPPIAAAWCRSCYRDFYSGHDSITQPRPALATPVKHRGFDPATSCRERPLEYERYHNDELLRSIPSQNSPALSISAAGYSSEKTHLDATPQTRGSQTRMRQPCGGPDQFSREMARPVMCLTARIQGTPHKALEQVSSLRRRAPASDPVPPHRASALCTWRLRLSLACLPTPSEILLAQWLH